MSRIPDFKTYLRESMWGGVMDRSAGRKDRNENDIDTFTPDGFYGYLMKHYKFKAGKCGDINKITKMICIPILSSFGNLNVNFLITYRMNDKITFSTEIIKRFPDLYKKMKENFDIQIVSNNSIYSCSIKSKDGKISNKIFLEILDFIIDNEDKNELVIERA